MNRLVLRNSDHAGSLVIIVDPAQHVACGEIASYGFGPPGGNPVQPPEAWYCREQWRFTRDRDVLSRSPEKVTALHCPRCGGGLEQRPDGACRHCGVKVTRGSFDWFVTEVRILERSHRGPTLTTTQPEVGTDWVTVYQRDFDRQRQRFLAMNPDFDWQRLTGRLQHVFVELQAAWSESRW